MSLLFEISDILTSRLHNSPNESAHIKLMELAKSKGLPDDLVDELPDRIEEFIHEFIVDHL
jgi:hypothetical protein